MLYFTLTVSLVHLACMNWLAYSKGSATLPTLASLAFGILMVVGCFFPLLIIQAIGLLVLFLICKVYAGKRPWVFPLTSALAVGGLFGMVAWGTWSIQRDLLERYPMQSMADRVPSPKRGKSIDVVPASEAWRKFEEQIGAEIELEQNRRNSRTNSLRKLHEETTETFVNSPGFGVVRMPNTVLRSGGYESQTEPVESIRQPEPSQSLMFSTEDLNRAYDGQKTAALRGLHFDALRDFVNFQGFGYIKDRQHVAGFRPHEFSRMPSARSLQIKRLELVSLLMHDQSMVYVSTKLPRMSELKHATTRTLSEFEAKGLAALQAGEDLFVRETPTDLHVLGAIRSVSQCVQCHGGERGDLLGAFSYQLR